MSIQHVETALDTVLNSGTLIYIFIISVCTIILLALLGIVFRPCRVILHILLYIGKYLLGKLFGLIAQVVITLVTVYCAFRWLRNQIAPDQGQIL